MRLIIPSTVLALTLFLSGCIWTPNKPPIQPNNNQTTLNATTTVDKQYPLETSIEGKTDLRYTKDGKKIYNNPELGLYFEYAMEWEVVSDNPFRNDDNNKTAYLIQIKTRDDVSIWAFLNEPGYVFEGTDIKDTHPKATSYSLNNKINLTKQLVNEGFILLSDISILRSGGTYFFSMQPDIGGTFNFYALGLFQNIDNKLSNISFRLDNPNGDFCDLEQKKCVAVLAARVIIFRDNVLFRDYLNMLHSLRIE